MKFKSFSFQACRRSWNLTVCPGKSWKIEVMFGRLATADRPM